MKEAQIPSGQEVVNRVGNNIHDVSEDVNRQLKSFKSDFKAIKDKAKQELSDPNATPETVQEINSCVEHAKEIFKAAGDTLSEIVEAAVNSGSV